MVDRVRAIALMNALRDRVRPTRVLWLPCVLALALALRLAAMFQLERSWYSRILMPDEFTYQNWASKLVAGEPHHIFSLSPLPAYVLGAVYWVTGPVAIAGRALNVALGVALCALVYAIGRELAGKAVGLLAALLTAVYRPFVLFSGSLLKEPLGLVLFAGLVLVFLREYRRPRAVQTLLLGALAGALLNVRQNAGLVAVLFAVTLLWRARRHARAWSVPRTAALLVAGAAAACGPFAVVNLRGTGRASPMPLGGFDLYLGNDLDAHRPYWSPARFTSFNPDTQGIEFAIEAERRAGRPMSLAQASDWWAAEVVRSARAHPGRFARRLGEKALAAVSRHEEADNHDLDFASAFVGVLRLPLLTYGVAMPFGLAALVLASARSRRAATLLAVVLAYGATMVLVFPNMRIRAPLLVILIPFAVLGLRSAFRQASPRRRAGFAVLVLVLAAVEALPVPNTPDLTAQHNLYAGALAGAGDMRGAEEQWGRAIELGGVWSDVGKLSLAYAHLQREDLAGARAWLERVPEGSVCAASKYSLLARVLRKQKRLAEAAAALERSIQINAAALQPRRNLIEIYEEIAPERVAAAKEALARVQRVWEPAAPPSLRE